MESFFTIVTVLREGINADLCFGTNVDRFRAASILEERAKRKERADKVIVDDFDRCVIRRTMNNMLILKKNYAKCKLDPETD